MSDTRPSNNVTHAQGSAIDRFAELEHLYLTAPVGLCLMDRRLRFLRVNERLAAINGRSVEDHLGRSVREVLPEIADTLEPIYQRVIDTAEPALDLEVSGWTPAEPGGTRHWLASHHPLKCRDGNVCGVSTVVQDITDLKRAQRATSEELERRVVERTGELDRTREMLAHVGRVSMMEELAGGLAHELNQPLTAIVNYAGASLAGLHTSGAALPELRDDLERIVEQAQRAAGIVRRIRMFVHKGDSIRHPTDIARLLDETVMLIAAEARRNGVDLAVQASSVHCVVDAIQIQQVIVNLADNAIQAMATQGSPRLLTIHAETDGDSATVTVRNTGPAIAGSDVPRIFDAMYTTRSNGLGLGLAIARTIIESHDGRLDLIENDLGNVAFRCTLPAMKAGRETEGEAGNAHAL